MKDRRNVLVFRDHLFAVSETFVYRPYEHMERFSAVYMGSKRARVQGNYNISPDRFFTLQKSGKSVRELLFKLFGYVPRPAVAWLQQHRPRLIHAHFAPDGALALFLARRLRIPLVVSLLGTDITLNEREGLMDPKSWYTYKLYVMRKRVLQRHARAFLVPSQFLMRKAMERGYPRNKLYWIPHGVDTQFFYPVPDAAERNRILFVGRLVPRKGLKYLLEAVRELLHVHPNVKVIVIGDGPERKAMEAWVIEHFPPGVVEFMGSGNPDVVAKEMRRAWIFSMPSVTMPTGETETFGMVFLEAQASGCPVVAFRTGGVPEVVKHGVTGFLVKEGDTQALARVLRDLLESPDLRYSMGQAARRWVEENFDIRGVARRVEALYEKILESGENL